jgi:RND family efflux transporter MFP subunit
MHRTTATRIASVVALVALVSASESCHDSQAAPPDSERVPVRVARAETRPYVHSIDSSGVLSADRTVQLAFKTGGIIAAIYVDEGDNVRKGQKLARLDLGEIRASAQKAKAGLAKAERDVERARALFEDGVATQEQLQDAATAVDVARSNDEIASFNLQHSTIRAPEQGRILRRLAEPGELTGPSRPIFTFGSTRHAWVVRVGVTDRDIVRLRRGDPAKVTFDAFPDEKMQAAVSDLAAAADPLSGTFDVELEIDKTKTALLPGMVAQVRIHAGAPEQLPFIPFAALTEGRGRRAYVFVADEERGRVEKVEVELAAIVDDHVAVAGGVDADSLVVTDGSAYLKDDDAITIVEANAAGATP